MPEGGTWLAEIDGLAYVSIPAGAVLTSTQPAGITATAVRLTPQLLAQLLQHSPRAVHVQRLASERLQAGEAAAAVQAWLDGELAALGLVLGPPVTWADIKAERDRRIEAGGYFVGGHWYHSDTVSRDQHARLYTRAKEVQAAGGNMDAPFPNPAAPGQPMVWKTMGNQFVPMTPAIALQIMPAAELQQASLHYAGEVARATLAANPNAYASVADIAWPAAAPGV